MLQKIPRRAIWRFAKIAVFFLGISLLIQLAVPILSSDESKDFVQSIGMFGPMVLICFFILSHIFAPVIGSPGVLLGFALFGTWQTMALLYIAGMLSAVINFWIARKFGRVWVERLIGTKDIKELDHFVSLAGKKMLIVARIFGYPFFEIISYAVGLTNMPFKVYYIITLVFAAIPTIVSGLLLTHYDATSTAGMIIWIGGLLIVGGVFGYFVRTYAKQHKGG